MKKLLLLFQLILLANTEMFSEVRVSGIIDTDTKWRAENGPYVIEGDIIVSPQARLSISPGTEVIISTKNRSPSPTPFDRLDSSLVSIRVFGAFSSEGSREDPIIFTSSEPAFETYNWRGIILEDVAHHFTEISFTEINGATTAITVKNSRPLIRNNIIENNNIAIHCLQGGSARIQNNVFSRNFTAAIKVELSNPVIVNNIIAFNRNVGMWCDNISKITFEHNCLFANRDVDFVNCDPEMGLLSRVNQNGDSTDAFYNLYSDPIFSGTASERRAIELDTDLPTERVNIVDTTLAQVLYDQLPDSVQIKNRPEKFRSRYSLSIYSPCHNAGKPHESFNNTDGTTNTIGVQGGPN
ncbi:right-handed parallel beta-helix repeat-containing protein [Chitinispirillales bacterium ANBcel5]|uniref:right-handed parallel beta-helix repeat-containing protein n=1 Tax=Cellulosispirillum alkaliphilum TaxID=3039283 RepID=UPI002A5693D1|nr:right-handed parallel beta-helix repeat-containing protein [Chitinispirillales bacterium ANBcel5]